MGITIDELVKQAMQLSAAEQAVLSDRILELACPRNQEWEAAWSAECKNRIAACERGEMATYDSDEVMNKLRKKYGLQ
ncbi:MAG: addiction module protein [Pseudomonadota bacterium]|nr:addiction module protein [Pseudomonadota bacterium]MDP2354224.1 addiction module protein [Pseudomonadota bacterium]